MSRTTNSPLPSQRHFLMLDALRGVAAISVAIYHACVIFGATQLLPKAFLAVDFFFLLSGIVVAHAYEERLKNGEIAGYLERRAIRLYPMILLGAFIGMSVLLTSPAVRQMSGMTVIVLGLSAVLCIPIVRANIYPGSHSIAPVNIPSWSLFFELFVNALYGLMAKRLTNRLLIAIVLGSLLVEGFGIVKFNGVDLGAYTETFKWGFARVLFPFFLGVLINRAVVPRDHSPSRMMPALLPVILVATLCVPSWGSGTGISELVAIAIIYPVIIIAAMNTTVASQQQGFTWVGAISYPLYAIHSPLFLWLARLQRQTAFRFPVSPYWWIAAALTVSVLTAWAVYKVYDVPVRESLTSMRRRYRSRRTRESRTAKWWA
jgi:peptidoglycan/LPS O-acetylase OafA/YrhL